MPRALDSVLETRCPEGTVDGSGGRNCHGGSDILQRATIYEMVGFGSTASRSRGETDPGSLGESFKPEH